MSRHRSYLLRQPTIVVCQTPNGPKRFVTLPSGAALQPISDAAESTPLLELHWDGCVVMMFRRHLEERATRIE
jgi:hypothetical protein